MLRDKGTKNISELKSFFTQSEKAFMAILNVLKFLRIETKHFGFSQATNQKYSAKNKLFLLLLYPLFSIKNPNNYCKSGIYKVFNCKKDIFYRLLNSSQIFWRKLVESINRQIVRKALIFSQIDVSKKPKCLILDDTDLPKRGKKIELMGKIFSHVSSKSILGFKSLFLSYFDGKSLFAWDVSLHGEMGKNKKRPQGMLPKDLKKRYKKKRGKDSEGKKRENEYFKSKIENGIQMIRRALKVLTPDYLLVDSWFTCSEIISFLLKQKRKVHFLGMIKMGKNLYSYKDKELTARGLVERLKREKKLKYSKTIRQYYCVCEVKFKGMKLKLFFAKASKRGNWKGIISTNLALGFIEAYEIYSIRWATEVFFKEAKQYLGLGKCESRDFDAQIASVSIVMLQYNLLSLVKQVNDYQTIGELFREAQKDTIALTIVERIWLIMIELINKIAEILGIDTDELMENMIYENQEVIELINPKLFKNAG